MTRSVDPGGEVKRIYVIIPVLNEQEAIGKVIDGIPREPVEEIVVVDNGSDDYTPLIARMHGAVVIHEPRKGYGHACLAGIRYVSSLSTPASNAPPSNDVLVFMDGDYSDNSEEIEKLLEPIVSENLDLVIGSRILGKREKDAMVSHAYLANRFLGIVLSRVLKERVTDLGPFRAIRLESLKSLQMNERTYGWTVEMITKAKRMGFRVKEIPVSYRKRIGRSKISGNPLVATKAFILILFCLMKYLVLTPIQTGS